MGMKPGTEPESACRADLADTPVTTAWLLSPAWDSVFFVASFFLEGALGNLCNSWAGSSDWWCLDLVPLSQLQGKLGKQALYFHFHCEK